MPHKLTKTTVVVGSPIARCGARAATVVLAILALLCSWRGAPACAAQAEPRPWLCRDKPAFSSTGPVRFRLTCEGKRRWLVSFMRLDLGGAHDGFSVITARELGPSASAQEGSLSGNRFFAVALYLSGGHWICARSVRENQPAGGDGVIEDLSYSDDGSSSCRLQVMRPAAARPN